MDVEAGRYWMGVLAGVLYAAHGEDRGGEPIIGALVAPREKDLESPHAPKMCRVYVCICNDRVHVPLEYRYSAVMYGDRVDAFFP